MERINDGNRQLYEYNVQLMNPGTQEIMKHAFYTFWSPNKITPLEIAEACAAQETILAGLHKDKLRYNPVAAAELITPYEFPKKLELVEE